MTDIIDGSKFTNLNALTFKKGNFNGSTVYNANYNGKYLRLASPEMLTWGIQEDKDQSGNPKGTYSIDLQFSNVENETTDHAFLENMKNFENKIIDSLVELTKKDRLEVKLQMNQMLKYPKIKGTEERNYDVKPSLKIKVPLSKKIKDFYEVEIYNTNGKSIYDEKNYSIHPKDLVNKYSKVKCMFQFGGIWYINKAFSVTWKIIQIKIISSNEQLPKGICYLNDDVDTKVQESDYEDEEEKIQITKPKLQATVVVESDDEDGNKTDNEEPEPVKTVLNKKPPVKKIISKQATVESDYEDGNKTDNEDPDEEPVPEPVKTVLNKKPIIKKPAIKSKK
jgi:hypothetical protein